MNIEIVTSKGDIIEFHLEVFDVENAYGIIKISDDNSEVTLPVLDMGIGQETNTLELTLKFKDLTVYADPSSYERLRSGLVDMEKDDGEDRATSASMAMRKV